MCKKICILMAVLGLAFSTDLSARKAKVSIETPASDSRIEYTGRTLVNGDEVSYDWSGVYFRIRFNGPSLKMKCSDTKNCWFNLWTDKEMSPKADKVFMVGATDTLVVLAEGLGKGMRSSCRRGPKENRAASQYTASSQRAKCFRHRDARKGISSSSATHIPAVTEQRATTRTTRSLQRQRTATSHMRQSQPDISELTSIL